MPQADGTIIIDTGIDTDGVKAGVKEIESSSRRIAKRVEGLGSNAEAAIEKQVASISKLNVSLANQSRKVNELKNKLEEFEKQEIPTEEYKELKNQLEEDDKKLERLIESQKKFISAGGKKDSKAYRRYQYDIDKLSKSIRYARDELKDLKQSGKAFNSGMDTDAAVRAAENLRVEQAKLRSMGKSLQASFDNLHASVRKYQSSISQSEQYTGILESTLLGLKSALHAPVTFVKILGSNLKKLPMKALRGSVDVVRSSFNKLYSSLKRVFSSLMKIVGKGIVNGLKKISSGILGIHKSANKSTFSFGQMLKNALLMGVAFRALSGATTAIKEGFSNLAQYSESTNSSISMVWSSLERLKNSLATAFAPILDVVAPILSRFIDMLSTAANYVGMFFSALTGKSTYTKAVAVQKDYEASLEDSTDATKDQAAATEEAEDAANGYLGPLDEIEKYSDGKSKESSGIDTPLTGNDNEAGEAPLFEESQILDSVKGLADKIKSFIENQDFEGLGAFLADAINKGLAKVKEAISWENVGPTITKFVTAFTTTFNSLVDNLDWDLLGRTIGEGINTIVNTLNLLITQIDWVNLGSKFAEAINGLADEVNFTNLGNLIGNKMMILPKILLGFVKNLDFALIGTQIGNALNGVVNTIDLSIIGEMLGVGLTGAFQTALSFSTTFDWGQLGTNIYNGINSFFSNTDWALIGESISEFLKGFLDTLITLIEGIDWTQVGESVKTTLANIDWAGIADRLFELIGAALGGLAAFLGGLLGDAVQSAKEYFQGKIEEAGGDIVSGILKGIVDGLASIAEWIYEHVFTPIMEGFQNAFGIHSPSTVMQEQGHFIVDGLLLGITNFVDKIKNKFNSIKDLIVSIFEATKDKVQSIFNKFVDIIRSPINSIIGFLNSLLGAAETAQNWIADALSFDVDIPWPVSDMVGFDNFSIGIGKWDLPRIPYLASGAVIPPNREFLAVLGDQKNGTNLEAPEDLLRKIVREETGKQQAAGGTYNFTAQINRRVLFQEMIEEAKMSRIRTGKNPFELA